jgi:hypothetical protein
VEVSVKNRLAFSVRAKKRKRVRKSMRIRGQKWRAAGKKEAARGDWNRMLFHFGNGLASENPTPLFFVSVASKGVRFSVSPLDATLVRWLVSVAFKGLASVVLRFSVPRKAWRGRVKRRARRFAEKSGRGCGLVYTGKNST